MPIVTAIENGEGFGEVEVEKAEGRESPLLIVETVDQRRECQNCRTRIDKSCISLGLSPLADVFFSFQFEMAPYPFRNISRTRVFRRRCVKDNKSRDGTELQTIKSVHRNGDMLPPLLMLPNKPKYVRQIHMRIFVGRSTHATAANKRLPRSLSE